MAQATILVVDDELTVRETLEDYLTTYGYRIVTAASAEAALEVLERSAVDLILTDVHMRSMSGVELCARLKGEARFQFTPIQECLINLVAVEEAPTGERPDAGQEHPQPVFLDVEAVEPLWEWTRPDGLLVLSWWRARLLDSSAILNPNPAEVAETRWATPDEVRRLHPLLPSNLDFLNRFCPRNDE